MNIPNLDELKAFLDLMREQGIEKGHLGDFAFEFGHNRVPLSAPIADTPEEKRQKVIDAMKAIALEDDENELWST